MEHGGESDQDSRASKKKWSKNSGNESKKMKETEESMSETESSSSEEESGEEVQSQETGMAIHSNYRHIVGEGGVRDEEEDAFADDEQSGEGEEESAEEEQFDTEEVAFTDETESFAPDEEENEEEGESQGTGVATDSSYPSIGEEGLSGEDKDDSADEDQSDMEEDAFADDEQSGEGEEESAEEEQFDTEEVAFTDETESFAPDEEENEEEGESQGTGVATDSSYASVGEEGLSGEEKDDSADEDQSGMEEDAFADESKKEEKKRVKPETESSASEEESDEAVQPLNTNSKNIQEVVLAGPNPPPPLPHDFKNWIRMLFEGQEISISEEILVIQKQLSEIETNSRGDWFKFSLGIIWNEFFTDAEIKILNIESFIQVTMIDPVVENVFVELRRKLMQPSEKAGGEPWRAYALEGDWYRFAAAKNLEVGDIVQLWAVRAGGNLCFHLVNLSRGAGDSGGSNTSIAGGTDTHESEAQANTLNSRELTRPGLPIEFKNKIQELSGANSIDGEILVIQKSLISCDVDDQQGCFLIPSDQILENNRNFLDPDVVAHLKMAEDHDDLGEHLFLLPVMCIDPRLKFSLLFLKKWNPNPASGEDSMCYGITNNWNEIKSRNNLKVRDILQLWAVRTGGNLWFVLHNLTTTGNETDEEPENNEVKKKISRNLRRTGLPMELSSKLQELTGAESIDDEILVIQKALTRPDVKEEQGCFFIPSDQILNSRRDFLDSDQVANLRMATRDGKHLNSFLPVMLIGPKLKICLVFLKRWITMETNSVPEEDTMSYVLTKTWNGIVSRNKLKERQIVQLWAVRIRGILRLALSNLTNNSSDSEGGEESSSHHDDHHQLTIFKQRTEEEGNSGGSYTSSSSGSGDNADSMAEASSSSSTLGPSSSSPSGSSSNPCSPSPSGSSPSASSSTLGPSSSSPSGSSSNPSSPSPSGSSPSASSSSSSESEDAGIDS